MRNQFYIVANICELDYFLKFLDDDYSSQNIVYYGIMDNATQFPTRQLANEQLLKLNCRHLLQVWPRKAGETIPCAILSFAERLKELRKRSGKTQEELSTVLKIKQTTYAAYESGISHPCFDVLISIARTYRLTVEELVKGKLPRVAIR